MIGGGARGGKRRVTQVDGRRDVHGARAPVAEGVDLDNACLRLPVSKTGQKSIYLNAPALAVLNSLRRLEDNPFVIPGERVGAHLVNLQKPWRRIRRVADLEDVRIHDLRHSFASVAAASGQSLYVIGSLLGHSQPQTTSRYAHLSADPLRAANDAVGDRIDNAMRSPAIVTNLGR